MTLQRFNRSVLPPAHWRWGETSLNWPDESAAPDPGWIHLPGQVAPLPGRLIVAHDLEPEATASGLLLPTTARFFESCGDARSPLQPNSGAVVAGGESLGLLAGDKVVVRPYQGIRMERLLCCRDVGIYGLPCFGRSAAADVIAYRQGGVWELFADWVCALPVEKESRIELPGGSASDVWRILASGWDAEIEADDLVVLTSDRSSPDWDAQFLYCGSCPFGEGTIFFRATDHTRGVPRLQALVI